MKALEKARERRYSSPSELAADLARHLRFEPVVAGPPGVLYRVGKLVRRHRVGTAAAILVLVAVIGGSAVAAWQALLATRAEREATQEAETAKNVTAFLIDILNQAKPQDRSPDDISIREVLDNGYAMAQERLADEPEVRAEVLSAISNVFQTLGLYSKDIEIQTEILEALRQSEDAPTRETGRAMVNHAAALSNLGTPETEREAEVAYEKAIEYLRSFPEPDHYLLGTAHNGLGIVYLWIPDQAEMSVPVLETAIDHFRRMDEPDQEKLAWAHQNIGLHYLNQRDLSESRRWFERAHKIAITHVETNVALHSTIGSNLANVYLLENSPAQAEATLADLQPKLVDVLGPGHPRSVRATRMLGNAAVQRGAFDLAARYYHEAIAMARDADPVNSQKMVGTITTFFGDLAQGPGPE